MEILEKSNLLKVLEKSWNLILLYVGQIKWMVFHEFFVVQISLPLELT